MLGYPVVGFRRDIVYFIPREVSFRVNCVGFKYEMLSVHSRIYISDDHNGVAAQTCSRLTILQRDSSCRLQHWSSCEFRILQF